MPVIEYVRIKYSLDYLDMVTKAGPIGILSGSSECAIAKSIRKRVETSITKNNCKLIAVVAHYDCAGNPIERDSQLEQMRTAVRAVESWDYKARVIGLWVDEIWAAHETG
jgi:hypothetical protein